MAGPASLHDALGDRYAIERELGHGATATVYLARDLKLNRLIALKVLSPDLALAVRTERFLTEIDTTAQLSHPHIVPLFEGGSEQGFHYYVMPYVRGETLRELIAREGRLSVEEALRLARQVAGALDHAHRHGVIHRDIKPGNILLEEGHARVADFGIARAIAADDSDSVTATGVTIGTPAYMSPEQASGDADLDARSDIYSLGCVLYEMLAGAPPFRGPTVQAVLTQHLLEPVPSLREARPEVPEQVEQIVEVALAKDREHRFATAAEFAQALSLEGGGSLTPTRTQPVRPKRPVRVPRWAGLAAGGVLLAVSAWVWGPPAAVFGGPDLDTLTYLVPPFEYGDGVPASSNVERLLQDQLRQWSPIKVMGRLESALGPEALGPDKAQRAAVRKGAGRYIVGDVSRMGDSLRVHATLYDAAHGETPLRDGAVRLAANLAGGDVAIAKLIDRLVFADTLTAAGTRSLPARQAFARGLGAVQEWRLAAADSAFVAATAADPNFAEGHLWLAQARYWNNAPSAAWQSSAERAAAGRERMSSRDRALSDALLALGHGEVVRACGEWQRLTRREPSDFAAWYGLANCLSRDDAVVHDPASPSGLRFRTSYHQTTGAYERAFQLLPAIHRSLRGGSYEFVRRLLLTSGSMFRFGHAIPPDTGTFAAYPTWHGDTLALVPYPLRLFGGQHKIPKTRGVAVLHERELFHDIATAWVTAFPNSADAVEALAISLDMLGDPTAADTLRRARTLATTAGERVRVAGAEVWLRVRSSIPDDLTGLRAARALADSLLSPDPLSASPEPLLLASLAAITGRARLAAALVRRPAAVEEWGIPAPLASAGAPLLTFAAFGGPLDSLQALERQVDAAIDRALVITARQRTRMRWLGRPAALAFPDYRFATLPELAGGGDYLLDAQVALTRGDTVAVRRMFNDLRTTREFSAPADLTLDALYPEGWLLAAIGEPRAAIAWLDPTLAALSTTAPEKLADPANAGALVQAMALRADLADRTGDKAAAARWARVVAVLWGSADPFLQPRVRRMEHLAGGAP